jgi:U6 snRNA-associated Sm-like protein LSm5
MYKGSIIKDEKMFPNKRVQGMVGRRIHVEMKGERCVLEGILTSVDDYLNLHLSSASEIQNGERKRLLGSVILRGNNVVLINPMKE